MSLLKKIIKAGKKLFETIWADEFKISLLVLLVAFLFINLPTLLTGRYFEKAFFENMLANANSMILDILVILCLTTYLIKKSEKKREIQRLTDEIDDFRPWRSEEATYRIRGSIFRLNKLGVTEIPLYNCFLQKANLIMADLRGANLSGTFLDKAELNGANLGRAVLSGADLTGANLYEANLSGAKFLDANMCGANLGSTNLNKAVFYGANLSRVNLQNAKNIAEAKGLATANLTDAILDEATSQFLARNNITVMPIETDIEKDGSYKLKNH